MARPGIMRFVKPIAAVALVVGVIAAVSVSGGEPAHPASDVLVPSAHEPDPTRFHPSWWQSEQASCPEGTRMRGGPPPDGFEIWCERPDGTRHGQHIGWWPSGRMAFERSYRDGALHGPWAEWRESGRRWTAGAYRDGLRHGRWVSWTPDGAATVTDYDRGEPVR